MFVIFLLCNLGLGRIFLSFRIRFGFFRGYGVYERSGWALGVRFRVWRGISFDSGSRVLLFVLLFSIELGGFSRYFLLGFSRCVGLNLKLVFSGGGIGYIWWGV